MLQYTQLPYTVLRISGEDAKTFLQGIITQDINQTNNGSSVYSLILNNKGRYLYNFFLTLIDNSYLITIDSTKVEALTKFLKFYKLRAQVEITPTTYQALAIWGGDLPLEFPDDINTIIQHQSSQNLEVIFKDPRLTALGYIMLTQNTPTTSLALSAAPLQNYTTFRYQLAVPEATELVAEKSIPIEWGFDELNALNYNKGCYLGQEFTNSAKRVLEIRKRIIAFYSPSDLSAIKVQDVIVNQLQEKIATVVGVHQTQVLALTKMSAVVNKTDSFSVQGYELTPTIPQWIKSYSLN